MSLTKVLLISTCMGVGSLAFANDPPADPTPPATTAATPPAAADAASTAAADKAAADKAAADKAKSAATDAKTAPGGITPDQAKTLRMAGYKADVRKGGQVYYCRYETQIGSRFQTPSCGTPEDILRLTTESQDLTNRMQHSYVPPPSR